MKSKTMCISLNFFLIRKKWKKEYNSSIHYRIHGWRTRFIHKHQFFSIVLLFIPISTKFVAIRVQVVDFVLRCTQCFSILSVNLRSMHGRNVTIICFLCSNKFLFNGYTVEEFSYVTSNDLECVLCLIFQSFWILFGHTIEIESCFMLAVVFPLHPRCDSYDGTFSVAGSGPSLVTQCQKILEN
jgi:hypothetical protein